VALEIPVCAACGHAVFPPRLACSRCGARSWRTEPVPAGVVEHVTVVRRSPLVDLDGAPLWLGLIRTILGPAVIARVEPEAAPGDRVELRGDGNAVIAVLPSPGARGARDRRSRGSSTSST